MKRRPEGVRTRLHPARHTVVFHRPSSSAFPCHGILSLIGFRVVFVCTVHVYRRRWQRAAAHQVATKPTMEISPRILVFKARSCQVPGFIDFWADRYSYQAASSKLNYDANIKPPMTTAKLVALFEWKMERDFRRQNSRLFPRIFLTRTRHCPRTMMNGTT